MLQFEVSVLLTALVCNVKSGNVVASEGANDFTCYPNQTIHFKNTDLLTHYKAFYNDGSGQQECTSSNDDNHLNVYFNCSTTNYSITAYFSDKNLTDDVIRGVTVQYTFRCNQFESYNLTIIGNASNVRVNHTVELLASKLDITCRFATTNGIPVTTAVVGETLSFDIIVPKVHNIQLKPLSCVAKGGNNSNIVITNGCSDDTKLVTDFTWDFPTTGDLNYMYLDFHVFKFYHADDITLTCYVTICISGDCRFSCGRGRGRGRRELTTEEDGNVRKVITLSQRLIVREAVLSGSSRAYGLMSLTVAMLIVLLELMNAQ